MDHLRDAIFQQPGLRVCCHHLLGDLYLLGHFIRSGFLDILPVLVLQLCMDGDFVLEFSQSQPGLLQIMVHFIKVFRCCISISLKSLGAAALMREIIVQVGVFLQRDWQYVDGTRGGELNGATSLRLARGGGSVGSVRRDGVKRT